MHGWASALLRAGCTRVASCAKRADDVRGQGVTKRSERRALAALAITLLLAGCFGQRDRPGQRVHEPPHRPRITAAETRQCLADLGGQGVRFQALEDRDFGKGCTAFGSVKLLDIGTPITNLGAMTCPLARTFSGWVRNGIVPAARVWLASEVTRVESFGTYSCRNVAGTGRLSEHASANAVDVSAVVLADGRRISIKGDWRSADPQVRGFLAAIHMSACKRFKTVLSPDYNADHQDHLHLDMGRGPFCR